MKMIIRDISGDAETTLEEFISNSMKGAYYMGQGDGLSKRFTSFPFDPEGQFIIEGDTIIQDKTMTIQNKAEDKVYPPKPVPPKNELIKECSDKPMRKQ